MSDAHQHFLNTMAQQRGFPDYETWLAWNRHRSESLRQPGGGSTRIPNQVNYLQQALGPIYPPTLFQLIGDRYRQATGQ